jgi:hypothetical protein
MKFDRYGSVAEDEKSRMGVGRVSMLSVME